MTATARPAQVLSSRLDAVPAQVWAQVSQSGFIAGYLGASLPPADLATFGAQEIQRWGEAVRVGASARHGRKSATQTLASRHAPAHTPLTPPAQRRPPARFPSRSHHPVLLLRAAEGVVGVSWNVSIMALRFLAAPDSTGYTSDAVACIGYALARKAEGVNLRVLSNSYGSASLSQALQQAVADAVAAGVVFVAAAGNEGTDNDKTPKYPAKFPGALTVAERISRETRKPQRGGSSEGFTVSIGVSFFPNKDTHSLQDMLDLVGAALERARREQGGKICLFQHQGYLYAPED